VTGAAHPGSDVERLATTRGLLALALPMAAGMGVGFLLHFINRLFLGWHSPEGVAASFPAGMLAWSVQGFFVMTAGYVGTFAAQHHAAGEDEEAGAMCWPALWVGLLACAVSLALIPARHQLVALFGLRDPLVAADMAELAAWYFAETGPIVLASALSVALNHWLIFGGLGVPALGITGAGLATLVASLTVLALWSALLFAPATRARFALWRQRNLDPARLRRFCRYALPKGGSEVLEMAAFLVFSAAITRLPTESVSASNIGFSLYLLVMVPFIGLGQGVSIAVGQCLGAGRADLGRLVAWRAVALGLPTVLAIAALFLLCPRALIGLSVAAGAEQDAQVAARWAAILAQGVPVLAWLGVSAIGDGLQWIFRMVVVGAGDTRWTLVAMVGTAVLTLSLPVWWLLRVADPSLLAGWGVAPLTASYAIFAAYNWAIALVMYLRFRHGPWAAMSVRR
jgi:MATE family multidrug resistance protein